MKRGQRLKQAWTKFRSDNDIKGRSYLNLGRFSLSAYLDYCYKQYLDCCYLEQIEPCCFAQYLLEE